MAKKKKDKKKVPSLREVPKKLQVWGLQETQKAVLTQAQNRYATESKVILDYQQDNWRRLVVAIAKEVGIPDDINVRLLALVELRETLVGLAIASSLEIDGEHNRGTPRGFRAFDERFGDVPIVAGIKLIPDRRAARFDDVLDARRGDGREHL